MTASPAVRGSNGWPLRSADLGEHALAAALIDLLASSPAAIERLVELLEDRGLIQAEPVTPAYTVASLADVLKVSPKVIRGAITREELDAVKRGGRWIISADAVRAWAHQHGPATAPRPRRRHKTTSRPLGSAIALLPGANAGRRQL